MPSDATNSKYFGRSWELLTKEPGWIKVLLVMGLANLVPIVGGLGTEGYAAEWARLIAWGSDASPKQKGIKVGDCIKKGWRAFVASIGYFALAGLITYFLERVLDEGILLTVLSMLLMLVGQVIGTLAAVRATIYQSFKAGYQLNRIADKTRRDYKGLCKIGLISLLISAVIGIILTIFAVMIFMPIFMKAVAMYPSASMYYDYDIAFGYDAYASVLMLFSEATLPFLILMYVSSVASAFMSLIVFACAGLWMRQFNVAQWGASADPLPEIPTETEQTANVSFDEIKPVAPSAEEYETTEAIEKVETSEAAEMTKQAETTYIADTSERAETTEMTDQSTEFSQSDENANDDNTF